MQQNKIRFGWMAMATLALALAGGARAQGGFGGGNMPPEIKAKIAAWTKWRDQNKNVSALSSTLRGVEAINKDPETQLNKQQSAKMLTIVNNWKAKPTMTDDQAKDVQKQITGMLNDKQLKRLNAASAAGMGAPGGGRPGGGMGGGMRPPGGAPGGGRPGAPGGFQFPDPPKGGFNPLNADTLPFEQMRPMAKKNMSDFTGTLQKQAK